MALGSQPSFTGIIGEWGETSYGGAAPLYPPMSMRNFLRGAAIYPIGGGFLDGSGYVPDNYGSTSGIASSGNLVMSSFKNTKAEWDGQACANEWYNYRGYYTRDWYYPSAYPGDVIFGTPGDSSTHNEPHNRYQSSYTQSYSYDAPGTAVTGYSKWHTAVDWVIGARNNITGTFGGQQSTSWDSKYGEMSLRLNQFRMMARNRSINSISYSRLGNNSGCWNGQFLLPGKWTVTTNNIQPVNNGTTAGVSGSNPNLTNYPYVVNVPNGAAYLFTAYSTGFDGNLFDTWHSTSTIGAAPRSVAWWYNSCVSIFWANNTGASQNISINGAWYPVTDKGGVWDGTFSAQGMFTTYHQDFILQRTY